MQARPLRNPLLKTIRREVAAHVGLQVVVKILAHQQIGDDVVVLGLGILAAILLQLRIALLLQILLKNRPFILNKALRVIAANGLHNFGGIAALVQEKHHHIDKHQGAQHKGRMAPIEGLFSRDNDHLLSYIPFACVNQRKY